MSDGQVSSEVPMTALQLMTPGTLQKKVLMKVLLQNLQGKGNILSIANVIACTASFSKKTA